MGIDDIIRHIFPYRFFAAIEVNVGRKEVIKINTIVLNPLTFITMIITNMGGTYFDEKREDVISITLRAVPKITAGIQVLNFTYEATNSHSFYIYIYFSFLLATNYNSHFFD